MFSEAELDYLAGQGLGRLATAQPNGTLQVSPVGYVYNPETRTIDITGYELAKSKKFRNVAANGQAAFVVDDMPSQDPPRIRCLEIRGRAEALTGARTPDGHLDGAVIRIHPSRIISLGVDDPDHDPLDLVPHNRNV
ncbi:PPOX class F420-dependent oxidoreductase [Amycolatopsis regifaucium]|uniref:Pyridoxamine 5'-phosphate oxidase n=1 Tax=Amycolatopsis regifaucium TaxID=546365 RepID=A0A154MT64_9PSEU|nr:PPOX class F420-dependent oxidoreductase [Amycolatopsis regifaucium]KZB87534.1 pyridoxamine 5'-phosphate oxidase [Amycolatopsis regifaucium]OKA08367.1 pyridoxamine 5'-phosphate oxidase [Amycolatopsis regifaucium]SFI08496.1 pyridoxamine 5'-phosphate oxidase family protein [Amycolatopsis regifaucium]